MKNDNQNLKYTRLQQLILWIIVPLFLLFITLLISNNTAIKVLIFLIGLPFVGLIVVLTSIALSSLYGFSAWKSIICTAVIFLLIPAIMATIFYSHNHNYLTSAPSNNRVSLRITAVVKRTDGAGSLGNELSYKHKINNTLFETGEIVEISTKAPFTITSTIIEHDDISDVGTTTSQGYVLGRSGDYSEEIFLSNTVKVVESGGRKNSGAYAIFSVKYTINRVIPSDYTFFDIYFFTNNKAESILLWGILFLGLGCAAFVIFVIYSDKKQEVQLEAEKKAAEERKLQEEKKAFIVSLGGKRIRDVAGVPPHIVYQNGKPKDNNNAEYGSFTVYLSNNGKCFHRSKGCCSSYRPAHYFTAKQYYKPCSKCGGHYYNIPEWHIKYMELKSTARKYGIDEE